VDNIAGGILKESGTAHWEAPNEEAYDGIFFDALPGGSRDRKGVLESEGFRSGFWSATEVAPFFTTEAYYRILYYDRRELGRSLEKKMVGHSVRCIMDQ